MSVLPALKIRAPSAEGVGGGQRGEGELGAQVLQDAGLRDGLQPGEARRGATCSLVGLAPDVTLGEAPRRGRARSTIITVRTS